MKNIKFNGKNFRKEIIFFSAFVSCYNEEKSIFSSLSKVKTALEYLKKPYEIIIIDDASGDNSDKEVLKFILKNPKTQIKFIQNTINKGLGYNFVEAAFASKGLYFRLFFGDDSESANTMIKICKLTGKADIILPYFKFKKYSRGIFRDCVSRVFTWLCKFLSGHNIKYFNGSPVVKTYDVLRWHSYSRGFGFQAEFISRLLDLKRSVIQVETIPIRKNESKSKAFLLRNILSVFLSLFELFQRRIILIIYKVFYKNWTFYDK